MPISCGFHPREAIILGVIVSAIAAPIASAQKPNPINGMQRPHPINGMHHKTVIRPCPMNGMGPSRGEY